MNKNKLIDAVSNIDEELVDKFLKKDEELEKQTKIKPNFLQLKKIAIAASLMLVVGFGIAFVPKMIKPNNEIPNPTVNPTVTEESYSGVDSYYGKYTVSVLKETVPQNSASYDLYPMTEKEMFKEHGVFIVRGEIIDIKNFSVVSENNNRKTFFGVIYVKVNKTYLGTCKEGDIVGIISHSPIGDDVPWHEDSETVSLARIGQEGIFLPKPINPEIENYSIGLSGKTIIKEKIASGFLGDGTRWLFLDTENGLVFYKRAYPGAGEAKTLDDIEKYVLEQLK